ncbi:SDR family oxidoreductase [Nocardioides sp. JQ2195]|uniref:SDR family oxidoreductase n=1 Tax=Nocardioides sp. JQ2195 TaxID=2592334 RepID=UPI00143EB6D6|nr:SDR family oxidoreductase [Nocardioides sp. JQ2195]QIX26775.1 SDR family oxidoreductase [Nocardioides sp. JQ2195]
MDLNLQDRVYVVTGGARGLGRATADQLVADGARVVLSGRDQDSLDAAVSELGENARGVAADNADAQSPGRLIEAAQHAFGRLDGVLISVGGPPKGSVAETADEDWVTSFESVFLGTVRVAREVAAALGDGGSITFVLSTSAKEPLPDMAISNGLRPGLAMVAKQLADELGPRGIRVNGLMPGRIDTARVQQLDELTGDAAQAKAAAVAAIPLGRYGTPEEFGRTAAFLMSPAASFLTGLLLPVDGGLARTL